MNKYNLPIITTHNNYFDTYKKVNFNYIYKGYLIRYRKINDIKFGLYLKIY